LSPGLEETFLVKRLALSLALASIPSYHFAYECTIYDVKYTFYNIYLISIILFNMKDVNAISLLSDLSIA